MTRGAFIVFEGLDRSGKSTQAETLRQRLSIQLGKDKVKLIKFPDRTTPTGQMIDSYLRSKTESDDHAIHLLFSANRWEASSSIIKDLEEGTIVICDRYAYSGVAFSAAKEAPGLSYEWCRSPEIGLPAPDLVVFLDVFPAQARERGGYGDERYENEKMQTQVRKLFEKLETETMRGKTTVWATVDANGTKEEVAADIWNSVYAVLEKCEEKIGRLWE